VLRVERRWKTVPLTSGGPEIGCRAPLVDYALELGAAVNLVFDIPPTSRPW
jgi:hypothetical protein